MADGGELHLERFGRLEELIDAGQHPRQVTGPPAFFERWKAFDPGQAWQQINVSPDFPTTARLISEIYPQSGGRPVDGVIAVDPPGLAAMLKLSGPVEVPGWPVPITSENVVDVTLFEAYEVFNPDERVEFLGEVARRVAEAFTQADLGRPPQVTAALGPAAADGHLLVWMAQPAEQDLVTALGVDGGVGPVRGDSILVVNQNLAGNKVDAYLRRKVRYDVTLDPSSSPASVRGKVEVRLENGAPASGLSTTVIGPYDERFQAGENRTYLSIYSPLVGGAASIDGRTVALDAQADLGRTAQSTTMSLPALSTSTVTLDVDGRVALSDDGWYRLDLLRQPSLLPDEVEVSVAVPDGWRIAEVQGIERRDERLATARMSAERERTILVRPERTGWAGVWERLTTRS